MVWREWTMETALVLAALVLLAGETAHKALAAEPSAAPAPARPTGGQAADSVRGQTCTVEANGLVLAVTPAKAVFAEKEPLAFAITLTNTSAKPYLLFDPSFGRNYQFTFGSWEAEYVGEVDHRGDSLRLDPQKTIQLNMVLERIRYVWTGPQGKPVPPRDYLPAGVYEASLTRKFTVNDNADAEWMYPHWRGTLSMKFRIEVADMQLRRLLTVAPYAQLAAKGTVKALADLKPSASWLVTFDPCAVIYQAPAPPDDPAKARPQDVRLPAGEAETLKQGDTLLFVRESASAYSGEEAAVRWTEANGQTLRFALAPAWQWDDRLFRCPMCRCADLPAGWADEHGVCAECKQDTCNGRFKVCYACGFRRGECMMCRTRIGPATKGVALRMGTLDPVRETKDVDPMTIECPANADLVLWVAGVLEHGVREAPELACYAKRLNQNSALCFLVKAPDGREFVQISERVKVDFARGAEGKASAPLTKTVSHQAVVRKQAVSGEMIFSRPGDYTVRAVAGRLLSPPVTVVVPRKEAAPAADQLVREKAKAQPIRLPDAPRPALRPNWEPGGRVLGARSAANDRLVWQANLPFEIGRLDTEGALWKVVSADGQQRAVLDAASGKILEMRREPPGAPLPPKRTSTEDGF